jgi:hypothetical protein
VKVICGYLGILAIVVGLATDANAATHKKKRLQAGQHSNRASSTYRNQDDSFDGYYEHRLQAVRFGSRRWWAIFDEQSGGSQRP